MFSVIFHSNSIDLTLHFTHLDRHTAQATCVLRQTHKTEVLFMLRSSEEPAITSAYAFLLVFLSRTDQKFMAFPSGT